MSIRPYALEEFRAMGSRCRIIADDVALVQVGVATVQMLESLWSRFRDDSEIARLNDAGTTCVLSALTYRLIATAEQARQATRGMFNPLGLTQLEAAGYGARGPGIALGDRPAFGAGVPLCEAAIDLFPAAQAVRLPPQARFDPGGIGKGLAGDIVVERLLSLGAASVQVELGGDVRVAGEHWSGEPWTVLVADTVESEPVVATLRMTAGAAATSSIARLQWTVDGATKHHLIDPFTGEPSATDLRSVTATSSELWWAEVLAKVALMAGSQGAADVLHRHGAAGVIVDAKGSVSHVEQRGVVA